LAEYATEQPAPSFALSVKSPAPSAKNVEDDRKGCPFIEYSIDPLGPAALTFMLPSFPPLHVGGVTVAFEITNPVQLGSATVTLVVAVHPFESVAVTE
jgi:hypothetical protein